MIKWVYNVVESIMQAEQLTIENTLPCTHATPRIGPAALRPGSGHTASQLEPGLLHVPGSPFSLLASRPEKRRA